MMRTRKVGRFVFNDKAPLNDSYSKQLPENRPECGDKVIMYLMKELIELRGGQSKFETLIIWRDAVGVLGTRLQTSLEGGENIQQVI